MSEQMKSYHSSGGPLGRRSSEMLSLIRGTLRASRNVEHHVSSILATLRGAEARIKEETGLILKNLDVLEVGTGQLPRQLAFFSVDNRVTGIDLDVIPEGFSLGAYVQMLRCNGPKRTAKTLARKALGFDRAFRKEMVRQLGVPKLPSARLIQMDASKMSFDEDSFDLAYSFDVFEHLPEPGPILRDIRRVLRPGGVSYHSVHLITAEDGYHDLRIISHNRADVPLWAHLREAHRKDVHNSAYLNKLRLHEWRTVFDDEMPGAKLIVSQVDDTGLVCELAGLREAGGLADYSDEELLSRRLVTIWQKPE